MPTPAYGHRKVMITCAVTGGSAFNPKHPAFPVTPTEIADSAVEAAKAGAAMVHVHVRDGETRLGVTDPKLFHEVSNRIRDAGVDVILNLTCGGLAHYVPDAGNDAVAGPGTNVGSVDQRVEHIELCRPEVCSLDVTTSNQVDSGQEHVYLNSTGTLRAMAAHFKAIGVKPELEVFEAGDIIFANKLIAEGLIDGTPLVQLVLGVQWNAPTSPETVSYLKGLLPQPCNWGALGVGRDQFPVAAASILNGGNVRVGLEDNLYLRRGVFATNGQLVTQAAQLIDILGHTVATPAEARDIIGLPPRTH